MDTIKKSAIPIIITALLLFPAGLIVGRATAEETTSTKTATTTHSDDSHSSAEHMHEMLEVAAADAPAITNLKVEKDAKSGWNVSFDTENFTFTPENASSEHVAGEGHAHIYVDGEKLTRVYSSNFYIDHLDEGEREIRVTLNANNHSDYAVDGEVVGASVTVTDAHHADGDEDTHSDSQMHSDGMMDMDS